MKNILIKTNIKIKIKNKREIHSNWNKCPCKNVYLHCKISEKIYHRLDKFEKNSLKWYELYKKYKVLLLYCSCLLHNNIERTKNLEKSTFFVLLLFLSCWNVDMNTIQNNNKSLEE